MSFPYHQSLSHSSSEFLVLSHRPSHHNLCNSSDLPEVEILSLIEEQIPKYRLRADTITDFCGYENQDWIQTPLIPIDEDLELSTEQIHETLKYFVLCSERLTQMTKTYNDIEAVNRLLEEKERDLELAAKIGQTLLTKNQEIAEKNDELEEQLGQLTERVNQLKHELIMKDGLLQAFTENVDISPSDESCGSIEGLQTYGSQTLHKKVETLEAENLKLRLEVSVCKYGMVAMETEVDVKRRIVFSFHNDIVRTAQLAAETSNLEEKEQQLMEDCVGQLTSIKQELDMCVEELSKKTEESGKQKEEITSLLAQVVDLQKRTKVLTAENMEYQKHLEASQESQKKLTKEVADLKDKHDELLHLYEEALEEIRELRRRQKPNAVKHNYMSASLMSLPSDSLASELESSLRGDVDYPRGYSPSERKVHNWKIFETAKAAKKVGSSRGSSLAGSRFSLRSAGSSMMHLAPPSELSSHNTSGHDSGGESGLISQRSSMYFSEDESVQSDGYNADLDSLYGGSSQVGRPGIPGSNDLETALRKLSLRRANELNELDYQEEADERKRHYSQRSEVESVDTPRSCRTPDSTLSTGSGFSQFSLTAMNNPYYRLPEKLRIVKPLEGSVTLRQWQQLATPNMGRLFESRPGVQTKGERKLDIEEENYHISDLEEDDEYQECPSKRFEDSHTINTYTNSLVKHPSESNRTSGTMRASTPLMSSSLGKPSEGTSTFSMSFGLAAILNERDLVQNDSKSLPTEEKQTHTSQSSNPVRVSSIISDTHFDLSKSKSSATTYSTSASSSNVRLSTQSSPSKLKSPLPQNINIGDKANQSVILDKLKNTGVSLYGYIGSWSGKSNENMSDRSENQGMSQNSTSSPQMCGAQGGLTTFTTADSKNRSKTSLVKGFLGKASTGGVIGALRDNGIL
ncbi:hypothetical protein FSP39_006648 [Pinctada imbricata]|uniref:Trafficking kinesin-binding protein 1 n=1 Tax=Pinctada imbricata TaxID=66713 RepID=A0AA88XCV2_PINIB|nr:hypothetical protein FSP39_006648 [Pinctada imbricata]